MTEEEGEWGGIRHLGFLPPPPPEPLPQGSPVQLLTLEPMSNSHGLRLSQLSCLSYCEWVSIPRNLEAWTKISGKHNRTRLQVKGALALIFKLAG